MVESRGRGGGAQGGRESWESRGRGCGVKGVGVMGVKGVEGW